MENQLNITYADKTLGADSFWAYMIQKSDAKEDPSQVTYSEAAQVIQSNNLSYSKQLKELEV